MEKLNKLIRSIGFEKLLILAGCGILLVILAIPSNKNNKTAVSKTDSENQKNTYQTGMELEEYCDKLEERLENLLNNIDGISNVQVMITLKSGSESVVLTEVTSDENIRSENGQGGQSSEEKSYRNESVVVYEKDSSGNTIPYVVKENVPQIEGIAIIAKGGDKAENVLKITSVAQALFNVEAHKISVIGLR